MRKSKTLTSFERYVSTIEDDSETPQYVVDCEGKLHDLSGNINTKLESVNKSKKYWEDKLKENPDDSVANRFYNKFLKLHEQIMIFLDSNNIVAHT